MGVCNCSMFCCTLLDVHTSNATILMEMRELVALLNLSSWCLVTVEWLFLAVPWCCLRFVIVVFPDHTHSLFRLDNTIYNCCAIKAWLTYRFPFFAFFFTLIPCQYILYTMRGTTLNLISLFINPMYTSGLSFWFDKTNLGKSIVHN